MLSLTGAMLLVGYVCVRTFYEIATGGGGLIMTKLNTCFLSFYGFVAMLILTGFFAFVGWPAVKEARIRMSRLRFGMLVAGLLVFGGYLPSSFLTPTWYPHSLHDWILVDYLQNIGSNLLMSTVPTTFVLMTLRPWMLVPEVSTTRVVCMAWAVLLVCYVFAVLMSLPVFGPVAVE